MKSSYVNVVAVLVCMISACAPSEMVTYKADMYLYIPRVYQNSDSKGYRKIQRQRIVGFIDIDKNVDGERDPEPKIRAYGFTNFSHIVSGTWVSYADCNATEVSWRYIGSNGTGIFKSPNLKFTLDLNPSYNIGNDEPDNTLIATLSCYGGSETTMRGYVTGQIGCGCHAYGHISPTRTISGMVSDVVPMSGMLFMRRVYVSK